MQSESSFFINIMALSAENCIALGMEDCLIDTTQDGHGVSFFK